MKKLTLLGIALLGFLTVLVPARADLITTNIFADAVVRGGGAFTNTNSITFTLSTGNLEVKSGSSLGTAGGVRKSYFKFNVPANMNTNANLVFTFTLATGSQNQRIQLWGLNQPYTNFNPALITWTNAQANNVANSNLLTSGGLTATLLSVSNVITTGAAVTRQVTVEGGPNGWGRVLQTSDNTIVLTLTGLFDSLYNSGSPIRIATNSGTLTFHTLTTGGAPSISSITDFSVGDPFSGATTATTNFFTVSDPNESASNLVMSAFSSNGSSAAKEN